MMIRALNFVEDWRCFKKDDKFDFRPGVNLLVGDQGCGKSSLIHAIHIGGTKGRDFGSDHKLRQKVALEASSIRMFKFDFEKDNPRIKGHIGDNALFQVASMWQSHGETNRVLIQTLEQAADCLCLMDEPDMALSIRSCNMLVRTFKGLVERSSQVIAAVHNETVIRQFEQVYSLEHRKWMTSAEFIETQREPTEFVPYRKPEKKKKKSGFSSPSRREKTPEQVIQEL
jgi:predicted ATPase